MSYLPDTDITFIDHARVHYSHALTSGLFRSLAPGDRRRLKLDVSYDNEGRRVEFRGFEPLGAIDLKVLQALVALSGPFGNELMEPAGDDASSPAEAFRQLYALDMDQDRSPGQRPHAVVTRATLRKVARLAGLGEGGTSLKRVRDSIERMSCVAVLFEKDSKRFITHFMTQYASEAKSGEFKVALNPVLSEVFFEGGRYARLSLDEMKALKSDPATLIHFHLCGRVDCGRSLDIGLKKLMGYIWPDDANTASTYRRRKQALLVALKEVEGLGWGVNKVRRDIWKITRPALRAGNMAPVPVLEG
ncbi:replication protein C, IncQ-type [Paracoccus tegillarcae]|uniref:Replication protein C n=1 Tax=Paracoccus tegillarcae TaxID=1529068 RepID=A0A2K9ERT8_9RHOB|nr:replication protein C, IncQ-type [Paracoccus tegillarcae]AUH34425.1 hypothetical protein CUV01_14435 [Paracoccus tegillarcae]